jgi:antitoxin VapB
MRRGEVRERLKRAASKAAIPERVSGVRIPPSPPSFCSFRRLAVFLCWHILVYMPKRKRPRSEVASSQRKAKIFMNNRSQAVRLPKEFQFNVSEVFIRKQGSDVVLSPRPLDWSSYLASAPVASESFMENVEDLPVQERDS